METQEALKLGIGNLEPKMTSLEPKKVKIVNVSIEDTPKAKKVVFECKHPDKEDGLIKISSASHIVDKQIKSAGTWLNLDEEENLQKGSALADFLQHIGAETIEQAKDKEVETELSGKYLCFKGY